MEDSPLRREEHNLRVCQHHTTSLTTFQNLSWRHRPTFRSAVDKTEPRTLSSPYKEKNSNTHRATSYATNLATFATACSKTDASALRTTQCTAFDTALEASVIETHNRTIVPARYSTNFTPQGTPFLSAHTFPFDATVVDAHVSYGTTIAPAVCGSIVSA